MAAESEITLRVTSRADTAGVDAAAKSVTRLSDAADTAGGANRKLDDATKTLTKSAGGSSQTMIQWSRTMQDAGSQIQNGLIPVLSATSNNIEQLFGQKWAMIGGAVTIAVTAFTVLADQLDIFGTKAKEAEEAAKKKTAALNKATEEARAAAQAAAAMAAADDEWTRTVDAITEGYARQAAAITAATAELERQARVRQEIAQLEGEGADIETDGRVQRGEITPSQGAEEKEARRASRAAEAHKEEQAARQRKIDSERKAAEAAEAAAKNLRVQDTRLGVAGEGAMTAEERAAVEARKKEAEDRMQRQLKKADELQKQREKEERDAEVNEHSAERGGAGSTDAARRAARSRKRAAELAAEEQRERDKAQQEGMEGAAMADKIAKDDAARNRTGGDAAATAEERRKLREAAEKAEAEAAKRRADAERMERERQDADSVFGLKERNESGRGRNRINAMKAQEREAAEREAQRRAEAEEREAQRRENERQQQQGAARGGRNLAGGMQQAGADPRSVAALEAAAGEMEKGARGAAEAMAKIAESIIRSARANAELKRQAEEMMAKIAAMRDGN